MQELQRQEDEHNAKAAAEAEEKEAAEKAAVVEKAAAAEKEAAAAAEAAKAKTSASAPHDDEKHDEVVPNAEAKPIVSADVKILVVLWDYAPRTKEDLKATKGERLRLINDSDADW